MKIEQLKVTVGEVCEDYTNDDEEGVTGYDGRLDIRPKYQREFVYKDKQRDEVVHTVMKGLPLNVIYWCKTDEDSYELLDGQQRTISICEYVDGSFSVDGRYFYNLPSDIKQQILDYELFVYVCDGDESEKLEWFKIINIAGEQLTDQELRNAVFAGSWTADAKRRFSKTGCAASLKGGDYLKGSSIRQEYLETALEWICDRDGITVEEYMGQHQHDANAVELWSYFSNVIDWVEATFTVYRREMKGLPWGPIYNAHKDDKLDPAHLESEIQRLIADDDVQSVNGIYQYLLDGNESHLKIRAFDNRTRRQKYEEQNGICPMCGKHFEIEEMDADHILQWRNGGKTVPENCQMLCKACNRGANR